MDNIVFIISHNSLSHSNNKEETSLRTFTLQFINIIYGEILRDCLYLIVFVLPDNSRANTYLNVSNTNKKSPFPSFVPLH